MNPRVAFGLSILMSLLSSIVVAFLFVWPWLRTSNGEQALIWLVAPHMFLRFIGLSFLVPGVVSNRCRKHGQCPLGTATLLRASLPSLPQRRWPMRLRGLLRRYGYSTFWGVADFLFAFYKAARVRLEPGSLGARFYIVTAIVPPLLVSHALIFGLLLRTGS